MFWLLKVLILHSDKLNSVEWCVLGLKSLHPHLHERLFSTSEWSRYILSYYRANSFSRCWFSPSGLNCESNNCSLCLCVRLCWGRGALWGTLDSQVTWLDNGFALLLSVTTFFLLISANVHYYTRACLYYAQSIPAAPGSNTAPWMAQGSNHALTNPPLTNRH